MILPAGVYTAKAVSYATKTIEKTGSDYIAVLFRITDGVFKGNEVVWRGFLTEKAVEDTKVRLGWCGWNGEIQGKTWVGVGDEDVSITVEHRGYVDKSGNAKTSVEVRWVNQIGGARSAGGGKDDVPEDKMRELALRIGAKVSVAKKSDVPF